MSQWRKFANSHTQTVREPDDRTKLYVHAFQGHYSYRVIRDKKEIAKGSGPRLRLRRPTSRRQCPQPNRDKK